MTTFKKKNKKYTNIDTDSVAWSCPHSLSQDLTDNKRCQWLPMLSAKPVTAGRAVTDEYNAGSSEGSGTYNGGRG